VKLPKSRQGIEIEFVQSGRIGREQVRVGGGGAKRRANALQQGAIIAVMVVGCCRGHGLRIIKMICHWFNSRNALKNPCQ
jgi:hypothetical protein